MKIYKYKNKEEIFKNIYSVLFSIGRKGLILFIPEECIYNGKVCKFSDLEESYKFFIYRSKEFATVYNKW